MADDVEGFQLSQQQRRAWPLRERRAARSVAVLKLPSGSDQQSVSAALGEVIARHEILRTAFVVLPGRRFPLQVPRAAAEVTVSRAVIGGDEPGLAEAATSLVRDLPLDVTEAKTVAAAIVARGGQAVLGLAASPLVADATSMARIADELTEVLRGEPAAGPSVRYVSYAAWQADQVRSGPATGVAAQENLAECLQVQLPFQRLHVQAGQPGAAGMRDVELTGEVGETMQDAAARLDVMPAVLILAHWQALLWQLTGESRFVVGVQDSGRSLGELADAVGPFARLLPVYSDIDTGTTLGALVKATSQQVVAPDDRQFAWPERFDDQYFPFAFLAEPAPDRLLALDAVPDRFAVGLMLRQAGHALHLRLRYDPAALPEAFADSMARQLEAMLTGRPADLDQSVARACAVTYANTGTSGPALFTAEADRPELVHQAVLRIARQTPGAIAVSDGARSVSYAELAQQVHRWRSLLRAAGVSEGSKVVLLLDRTPEAAAILIAVMSAGAAAVPLDPAVGTKRVVQILTDCAPDAIVASRTHAERVRAESALLVVEEQPQAAPATAPVWSGNPSLPCYVLYTSGSTGTPKAAVVSHANLAAYTRGLWQALGLTPTDRYLHTASLGFSSAMRQMFLPLCHGGAVILASAAEIMEPARLCRLAAVQRATVLDLVPSYWARLCVAVTQDRGSLRSEVGASSLRLMLSASEPLTAAVADAIRQLRPGDARLVNMFGLTETTGIAATAEVGSTRYLPDPLPIGRPIAGAALMVADERLAELPVGVTGEIIVVGATVGAGYLDDPELTARKFIQARIESVPVRAFRTGDLGRRMPDGQIQFVGRLDKQAKIRGFRVEPAEIEAALARHPAVQEAVVLVQAGTGGDPELKAFILPHRDQKPTRTDIVSFARQLLPTYMIPASFQLLTRFPRTVSGKVDATALSEVNPDSRSIRPYVPPVTEEETSLAQMWAQVLGVGKVGRNDDFFELGGHSLLGIDVLAQVQDRFGVTVPWSEVFVNPTLAGLAAHIADLRCVAASHASR